MIVAAVATESAAEMDSDTDGVTDNLAEIASAADAASLVAAFRVVFEDGLSVAVELSAMLAKKIKIEDVASVAVAVSLTCGVKVAALAV